MNIDSSWNFKQLVDNLQTLKQDYNEWLASFLSCQNSVKIVNQYKKYLRDSFYSLNIKEWQIDMCWEYLNDDKLYFDIVKTMKRMDKATYKCYNEKEEIKDEYSK